MQTLDQEMRRRAAMRRHGFGDASSDAAMATAEQPQQSGVIWSMVQTGIVTGLTVYFITRAIEEFWPRNKSGAEKYLPKSSCER